MTGLFDHGLSKEHVAGTVALLSQDIITPVTADVLAKLGGQLGKKAQKSPKAQTNSSNDANQAIKLPLHEVSKRLTAEQIAWAIKEYEQLRSATDIAKELKISTEPLLAIFRDNGLNIRKSKITDDEALTMAKDYDLGLTVKGLEDKYGRSKGAVLRALHRQGVRMRQARPRIKG